MSANDRQSRLLVAEDWKRIYQSFRNADFQSYDFDNLRRTMINYLRQNYPEDFNDYIESSEYLALIDMIAFLGQNLSFRIDLNARENFLETAERRESVLRLARMLSYNPRRNQAANGLLKFDTIKTTENLLDSNGLNLAGLTIKWNDQTNTSYFEQFVKILNSALPLSNSIGNPLKSALIADVQTQKYRLNASNTGQAIYPFTKRVEGVSTRFEVVSTDITGESILEEAPLPGNSPAFLFRDDGSGAGSANTGFFMHFRQGKLETGNFNVANPTPNQSVQIDAENINDSDIWLFALNSAGFESNEWTKIDAVEGNNVIYNSLFNKTRDVFAVTTRIGDRINLVFSDGVFGNLPAGNFRSYYRTSNNLRSVITPSAINTVSIDIPYQSRNGSQQTLTVGLKLNYTVSNGAPAETNTEIKQNAPATYYTQNRLVTGEDYNIGPLAISQNIIKTKSSNRISSGISRFFDLKDASGKYSNTSLFADDGVIYKEEFTEKQTFTFNTQTDIEGVIYNTIESILGNINSQNFYLAKYPKIIVSDLNATWTQSATSTNQSLGLFNDIDSNAYTVGTFTANSLRLLEAGAMLKFVAPAGKHFMPSGILMDDGNGGDHLGKTSYKWCKVISVTGNGTIIDEAGLAPIVLNDVIPTGAILEQIVPNFSRALINDIKIELIDQTFEYKDFALRYDQYDRQWKMVLAEDINTLNNFATGKAGDITGENLDASWMLYFKTDGEKYTITYRNLRYVMESADEIRFFFDAADKIYDPATGQIVRDKINILNINRKPGELSPFTRDFGWTITDAYRDSEGYLDSRKIQVQFIDLDDDGIVDDPTIFEQIVGEEDATIDTEDKLIFQKKYTTTDGVEDFKYFSNPIVNTVPEIVIVQNEAAIAPYSSRLEGQIFYLIDEDIFRKLNKALNNTTINTDYKAYFGRADLKFHYTHVADSGYRIDPSASNIIDTYILTKTYDTQVKQYIAGSINVKPKPPSNDELFRSYGSEINKIKSLSDELIYHPVKYKILFGDKAAPDLQVKFKIVKNTNMVINDNELKSNIIEAINKFFDIENWDFGETFYFQELSAYIINQLSPKLVSILIVPRQTTQSFGSLFEIKSEPDEIFASAAKVTDIETIDQLTATNLQASGTVINQVSTSTIAGITSSASTSTSTTTTTTTPSSGSSGSSSSSSNGGGYSY
jgi:hypothetical protein